MKQLVLHFFNDLSSPLAGFAFPKIPDLYLKDDELSNATLIGILASFIGDSSF